MLLFLLLLMSCSIPSNRRFPNLFSLMTPTLHDILVMSIIFILDLGSICSHNRFSGVRIEALLMNMAIKCL